LIFSKGKRDGYISLRKQKYDDVMHKS